MSFFQGAGNFITVFLVIKKCYADCAHIRFFALCRMPGKNFVILNKKSVVYD